MSKAIALHVTYWLDPISRQLELREALNLWDAVYTTASIPCFWELKRTRAEQAEIGYRPT